MRMAKGKQLIRNAVIHTYRFFAPKISIDKKLVVFDASQGRNYTGSPRAVYEYMVAHGLDQKYQCVWFFKKGCFPDYLPGKAKMVSYAGAEYLYLMAKAKYWIFDARNPYFLIKKKDQLYIQTWHGTPLKKLGLDMERVDLPNIKSIEDYHEKILLNSAQWDYLIAQNDFSATIFRRCFGFQKEILRIGYPRNDILFHKNNETEIEKLKERYGLPKNKKIILYAPTFRDTEHTEKGDYYFDLKLDLKLMQEKMKEEYILIPKLHYLVSERIDYSSYQGFVYQPETEEISHLYLLSDLLVTDYSSVMFDYTLLKRPVFFYCYDLEEYKDQLRGFYFDFVKEAPGPISRSTEELIENIRSYDVKDYRDRITIFEKKFHEYDDGTASQKIVELMEAEK